MSCLRAQHQSINRSLISLSYTVRPT